MPIQHEDFNIGGMILSFEQRSNATEADNAAMFAEEDLLNGVIDVSE